MFEIVCDCFESSKDVLVLKLGKQLGVIYLLKSLSCLFPISFDIVILLIWQEILSLDIKGTGKGHRIVMIAMS